MSYDTVPKREASTIKGHSYRQTNSATAAKLSLQHKVWRELRGYLEAFAIAYLVVTFVFTTVGVSGVSMEPTLNGGDRGDSLIQSLLKGDRVLVPKYETWLRRLGILPGNKRGDIVVLREPSNAPSAPEKHRRRIRTTNGLERFNQELKRRTRVVRIFPNREACLRLVTALCVEQSEEWLSGRRYLDMSLLDGYRAAAASSVASCTLPAS